jgi:hypothetical protein
VAGKVETSETATTTGEFQVVGTATVAGTTTNEETGTEITAVDGTL